MTRLWAGRLPSPPPSHGVRAALLGRSAQALVETALLLPLLMVLVGAAVDGGQLMAAADVATSAAGAGARAAAADVAQGRDAAQIELDAQSAATLAGGPFTCSESGAPAGCVEVTATTAAHGSPMEVVTVYETPSLLVAVGGALVVSGQGAASP